MDVVRAIWVSEMKLARCGEVGIRLDTELRVPRLILDRVRIVSHHLLLPLDLVVALLAVGFG